MPDLLPPWVISRHSLFLHSLSSTCFSTWCACGWSAGTGHMDSNLPLRCPTCSHDGAEIHISSSTVLTVRCGRCSHVWCVDLERIASVAEASGGSASRRLVLLRFRCVGCPAVTACRAPQDQHRRREVLEGRDGLTARGTGETCLGICLRGVMRGVQWGIAST